MPNEMFYLDKQYPTAKTHCNVFFKDNKLLQKQKKEDTVYVTNVYEMIMLYSMIMVATPLIVVVLVKLIASLF